MLNSELPVIGGSLEYKYIFLISIKTRLKISIGHFEPFQLPF